MFDIITIWKEKGKILEGIQNNIFKKEDVEIIAASRYNICIDCDRIDHNGKHCAVPFTQPCCSECGCSLKLKTRSLSTECPIGRWNSVLTEKEEDLLEEKLNQPYAFI